MKFVLKSPVDLISNLEIKFRDRRLVGSDAKKKKEEKAPLIFRARLSYTEASAMFGFEECKQALCISVHWTYEENHSFSNLDVELTRNFKANSLCFKGLVLV